MKKSITTLSLALLCLTLFFSFSPIDESRTEQALEVNDEKSSPEESDQVTVYLDWINSSDGSLIGYFTDGCGSVSCNGANYNYDFPMHQSINDISPLVDVNMTQFPTVGDMVEFCFADEFDPTNCTCICLSSSNGTTYTGQATLTITNAAAPPPTITVTVTVTYTLGSWPVYITIV